MKKHYHKAVYFDVDETLILWEDADAITEYKENRFTKFRSNDELVIIDYIIFKIHYYHVNRLIQHSNNGDLVIVWSAGGKGWADRVIDSLNIRKYVDIVLPKPDFYYDDMELKDFSSKRMFFDPETLKFKR